DYDASTQRDGLQIDVEALPVAMWKHRTNTVEIGLAILAFAHAVREVARPGRGLRFVLAIVLVRLLGHRQLLLKRESRPPTTRNRSGIAAGGRTWMARGL